MTPKIQRPAVHAAVAVGDKVYSFAGSFQGEPMGPMEVHMFNTVSLRWEKLPPVTTGTGECPSTRYRHTAVLIDNVVYIWGGFTYTGEFSNVLYAYAVDAHRWFKPKVSGTLPEARHDHSACVLGKVMYIFGGHDKDVYKLDTDTMVWSLIDAKGLVPPASVSHSATIIGTKMFVFGGLGHQGVFDSSIRVFNTVTNRWLSIPSQPSGGRINHSAFAYNGELYIFGCNNFERCFDELWKFNPETFSWKQGERLSSRLNCVCSCMVGGRIFLFGGGNTSDDLHIIDLLDSFKTLSKKWFSKLRNIRDSKRQPV